MTTAQARFWMRVRFQKRRAGWRGWVGDWLRRAAYRLDRLPTMTIDIDTVPPLSGRQKADIYRAAGWRRHNGKPRSLSTESPNATSSPAAKQSGGMNG